jgi:Tfp pilus assembly protein PilF
MSAFLRDAALVAGLASAAVAQTAPAPTPGRLEAPRADSARAHLLRGAALEREGQLEPAAGEYRAAVALAPKMAEAHDRLGFVLGLLGRTAEALDEFKLAVALQPSSLTRNTISAQRSGGRSRSSRRARRCSRL